MSKWANSDIDLEENKVDWNELMGESPKYLEISKFEFMMVLGLILFIYFVLQASIWGLWSPGDE